MELTNSFEFLLRAFSPVFTEPSFQTFRLLMTGWILSVRHRYVTDLIISSDSVGNGHFSDYHRFFSQAVWDIDRLWKLLAQLIVNRLVGADGVVVLSGDDTLCRKRGMKTQTGLYYKAGNDRLVRLVFSQDTVGQRPTRIFYCTDLSKTPREILSIFSQRWSIEVTHYDCKQHLGLEDPANRTPKAVERTAPMAMFLSSLTIVWFETEGHKELEFPNRPWYSWKPQPSFADMLTTLRRQSWDEKLSEVSRATTPDDHSRRLLTFLATLAG